MYHKHHTKGIILSGRDEGNDSRRVHILTDSLGFLNARVQGARNIQSKLRAASQDFSLGQFSLVHGKGGWRLVGASAEKNFFETLKDSPQKFKIACNILGLVKKLAGEESGSPLFSLVSNFLHFLISAQEREIALGECLTILRILHSLGYLRHDPELSIPISSSEIQAAHLDLIAPRRSHIIALINESLKTV
jgi:DNA repair protein RecO